MDSDSSPGFGQLKPGVQKLELPKSPVNVPESGERPVPKKGIGVQGALQEAQEAITRIVAVISELHDLDHSLELAQQEASRLKELNARNDLPKFSYLKLLDLQRKRMDEADDQRRVLTEEFRIGFQALRGALARAREVQSLRAEFEHLRGK